MDQTGAKNVYRRLGDKIDNLTARTPWNETFHSILKELYTTEEAEILVKMPYTLSSLDRISQAAGVEKVRLQKVLEKMCDKGLILDIWRENENQYYYMPSPMVVGIFEFTMMRTGDDLNSRELATKFHEYFEPFISANFSNGEQISALRVMPIEETIRPEEYIEFFDYEKASSIIENSDKFALALCACRNGKFHRGEKQCDVPLDNCSSFGMGADFLIRHNLAKEVSKSEMLENFARSKELGLVLSSTNTKKTPLAVCHCCKCCCEFLGGLNRFGFTNSVVTSNFISKTDKDKCTGCGKCVEVCPVNAMSLVSANDPAKPKKKKSRLDTELCVGCGVCALKCPAEAIEMTNRGTRVIHPETIFESTILSSLERGTLQNQIFDNPQSVTQKVMRPFIGAFLRLTPVKKALMSDTLRSSFLNFMKKGVQLQGKGWIAEL
jgi:ferredoxin